MAVKKRKKKSSKKTRLSREFWLAANAFEKKRTPETRSRFLKALKRAHVQQPGFTVLIEEEKEFS